MSIPFTCPVCGKQLTAADKMAGRRARCTECDTPLTVPGPIERHADEPDTLAELTAQDESIFATLESTEPAPLGSHVRQRRQVDSGPMFAPTKPAHDEDLIDMTAMVDIVFFLLIFFLVTSLQAVQAVLNLPKPEALASEKSKAAAASAQNDPNALRIKIEEDDSILVDDEEVFGEEALWLALKQIRDERSPEMGVVVIGSPDASHGAAVKVLDACASAQLTNVRFLIEESDE